MKKLLSMLLLGVASFGIANADQSQAPQMPPMMMDSSCKPALEHMRTNHQQVEAAIKANDANKVGTLMISNHNYMESFMAQNPQCKPPKRGNGMGGGMGMGMMPPSGNNSQDSK